MKNPNGEVPATTSGAQPHMPATGCATISVSELQSILRRLQDPSYPEQIEWKPVYLMAAWHDTHPERTAPQVLGAVLRNALDHLAKKEPLAADLLRGRYWEGLTVDEMLHAERPQRQSQRRFFMQQKRAIQLLADTLNALERSAYLASHPQRLLQSLPAAPYDSVFGLDDLAPQVQAMLSDPQTYIVSIQGIGGIGKTTLAHYTVRQLVQSQPYWANVIWISAKQEHLSPMGVTRTEASVRLEQIFGELAQKLGQSEAIRLPLAQKVAYLAGTLKKSAHLVIIDNLETVEDFEQLIPWLMQLAEPTRFLLTSRQAVRALSRIRTIPLHELDRKSSLALIEHTACERQIADIDVERIYQLVGGSPLAIQLVVSQMQYLPPSVVLDGVRRGTVEEMYTFIYRNAWLALENRGARDVILSIQRAGSQADWAWLTMDLDFSPQELQQALGQLHDLSLVQVYQTGPDNRTYGIHRLTSTFLSTEVLGWK